MCCRHKNSHHKTRACARAAVPCAQDPEGVFGFSKDVVMQETMVQIFPPKGVNATVGSHAPPFPRPLATLSTPTPHPTPPHPHPKAVQIASGADHIAILAETDKGRRVVYTLGSGLQGQLGRVSQRHSARNGIREHPRTTTPADVAKRRTTVAALETLLTPMPVESRELKRAKVGGCRPTEKMYGCWQGWMPPHPCRPPP